MGPCWLLPEIGYDGLGRQNGRNPSGLRDQAGAAVRLGAMGIMETTGRGTELTGEQGKWMVCVMQRAGLALRTLKTETST